MTEAILEVEHLAAAFATDAGLARAVDDVSFIVRAGTTLGIVGESGCGKSVTSLSIMRLLPRPAGRILAGAIRYRGEDLVQLPVTRMHEIRGNHISMIFQEPMTALNPVQTIGRQLAEVFELHQPSLSRTQVQAACLELLQRVGIPAPERRLREYPHQMSGGMRQRVVIAIALACQPDLLIADEPTTALDVTIQAQILTLIRSLQAEHGMAVLFITHDLGVIAQLCDEVVVMYAGQVVEAAPVEALFAAPRHPYTRGLLGSIPRLGQARKSRLATIDGMVPSILEMPSGCRFQNRCPYVAEQCRRELPQLEAVDATHTTRCWRWRELPEVGR